MISVFDVIGPNMIGPSSSHTAGALRIAQMAGKIVDRPIKKVTFVLYGSFARTYRGHGTDRALVAGILGYTTEDKRIRDSFQYAEEAGVEFHFETNTVDTDVHPNTVEITITDDEGNVCNVVGESIGGGKARITRLNGLAVTINGDMPTLVVMQHDQPGVIARITDRLYLDNVNIAFIDLYRENKNGMAVTVLELDSEIEDDEVVRLRRIPGIESVNLLKF